MSCAVVLGLAWPGYSSGPGVAVLSSLREYAARFDRVLYVAFSEHAPPAQAPAGNVEWAWLPVSRPARGWRFLRSLPGSRPATTVHLATPGPRRGLRKALETFSQSSGGIDAMIFEGLTVCRFLPELKQAWPGARTALRSFDVTSDAFAAFTRSGSAWRRWAWGVEVAKLRRFEREVFGLVDCTWAISSADSADYRDHGGLDVDGVFGVAVEGSCFQGLPRGDAQTVLYIGSADLRKSAGLRALVESVWPRLKAGNPGLKLVMAGRGTERFSDPAQSIEGLGPVEDDRAVWGRGAVFVNVQDAGSGIKIKSLHALAAGKTLVSTAHGVRGLGCVPGTHCYVGEDVPALLPILAEVLRAPDAAGQVAEQGRRFVEKAFSVEALHAAAVPLLDSLLAAPGSRGGGRA